MTTSSYLLETSREYATYVLENRATPMITDGLKVSQRIALYLLRDQVKPTKTAGLVGQMMASNLYVHGDAAAADMIGRLAAPFLNNHPLIQGEGAFGTRVAPFDGIGAPRYTEVRRSKFAEQHLYVDMEIGPLRENYDGSAYMAQTFLPRLPLILLNGVNGIAVGFANKILPRKLDDLRAAVLDVLKDGKTERPLVPHYELYNVSVVRDATNPKKWFISGKVQIKNSNTVVITEIPPGVPLDKVRERLIALEDAKRIETWTDNSTDHIDITVKMTRAALKDQTETSLIELFKLSISETENLTVLAPDGKTVREYQNVQDIVRDFVEWRLGLYLNRYQRLVGIEHDKALFERCFLACFDRASREWSVVEAISVIESKRELVEMVETSILDAGLELRKDIVDRIVGLPIFRWTQEGQDEARERLREAERLIDEYQSIIDSPNKRKKIYVKEIS